MKKSFYFALALTAGLFASCSSDDLTADAPGGAIDVNDNAAAQININVGNPGKFTRGTGSVLGSEWGGQTFNLFMFNKGTFEPATYTPAGEGAEETNIYYNAVMTTKPGTTTANQIIDGGYIQYQYFPSNGRFDFWAYRADDAADVTGEGDDAVPTVNFTDAEGNILATDPAAEAAAEATQVRIPFTITGSQDLMIAETKTAEAAAELEEAGVSAEDAPSYIYSAYAARRGVNPKMTFKHQLTRLQFQVKAATRDVSTQATPKMAAGTENEAGDEYYAGYKVTKVEVWSKSKGSLIAAYKGEAPESRVVWATGDEAQAWVSMDDFNEEETSLAKFELMERESNLVPADIKLYEVGIGVTSSANMEIDEGYELKSDEFDDDTECYLVGTTNATTGEPTGTKYTRSTVPGDPATIWLPAAKDGKWNAVETESVSEGLNELTPVIPQWEGYDASAGWRVILKKAISYQWSDELEYDEETMAGATEIANAPTDDPNDAINKARTDADVNKYFYYKALGARHYVQLEAIEYNIDNADLFDGTEEQLKEINGDEGDMAYIEGESGITYYIFAAADADPTPGEAVVTPIGESLLVAPADENGYIVRFTYKRCVVISSNNDFEERTAEAFINVKTKSGSFSPSKFYTVTAVLYNDGELKLEEGDIEEQEDGSDDLDDGEGHPGYGLEN